MCAGGGQGETMMVERPNEHYLRGTNTAIADGDDR
jgi:hypothetical protein